MHITAKPGAAPLLSAAAARGLFSSAAGEALGEGAASPATPDMSSQVDRPSHLAAARQHRSAWDVATSVLRRAQQRRGWVRPRGQHWHRTARLIRRQERKRRALRPPRSSAPSCPSCSR